MAARRVLLAAMSVLACLLEAALADQVWILSPSTQDITYKLKSEIKLTCNISSDNSTKYIVQWTKDDKLFTGASGDRGTPKPLPSETQTTNTVATLTLPNAVHEDAGNYTCRAFREGDTSAPLAEAQLRVSSAAAVRLPANLNVVEGEPLRLQCQALGNPLPSIKWVVGNRTYEGTEDEDTSDRVEVKDFDYDGRIVVGGEFVLSDVNPDDRGHYTCVGTDLSGTSVNSTCMVRVTGKYAALWPFLGICAEVIVLCAIIVIYEKKRNKTELEESDTDQSPDQKQPEQGKDANLRHRQ